jgi:hypothetical protein
LLRREDDFLTRLGFGPVFAPEKSKKPRPSRKAKRVRR